MSKSIQSFKERLNNDFLRKLSYKVLIWNIFKAKLNAWNDSNLVLLREKEKKIASWMRKTNRITD